MPTWYVSQQRGSDTNSGTSQSQPFATIGRIVNEPSAKSITNIVVSSGTATCNCTEHGYTAGWVVWIAGMTTTYFNTYWTILSVPDANSFTFAVTIADGTYTGTSPTAKAPIMGPWARVYVGPGTYRERLTCYNAYEWSASIQAASGTPPTSGGLVRSSGVVTVTAASGGAFAGLSAGMRVVISGATSDSFDGIWTIASVPTTSTFTFAQDAPNEISGGGTVYGYREVMFDPDCRYLTSDKPGTCRVTGANSAEIWTSGAVINFNSANQLAFVGYDDASGVTWNCDGSSDSYAVTGNANQLPWRQMVRNCEMRGYNGGTNIHADHCTSGALNYNFYANVIFSQCWVKTTGSCLYPTGFFTTSRSDIANSSASRLGACGCIGVRNGTFANTSHNTGSCYLITGTMPVSGARKIFFYRSSDMAAESGPTWPASIAIDAQNYDLLGWVDRTTLGLVRNLADVNIAAYDASYTYSIDLSSECTRTFTATCWSYCRGAFLYVSATNDVGSVTVELQKYVSGSWTTQAYKTRACSDLSTGWQYFEFDNISGDVYITKTGSLWRLRVTHSGPGTETTIGTSTSGSRTSITYIVAGVPLVMPCSTDFDGRWRPAYTFPANYKHMIGCWEYPAMELEWSDVYSTAPGVKLTSPGDEILGKIPVRGGVETTIAVWCKQYSCNSARCPRLVVWGNGLGDALSTSQVDVKAYDSSWEQLSVTFTADRDGVVMVVARHYDYTSGSYSVWSDWSVSEA